MASLSIPQEAVKFIAFQRTDALHFPKSTAYSVLKRFCSRSLYNLGVSLETRFCSERIKTFYSRDMEQEFNSLREHLPSQVGCVLDIGCGVAGIDAYLFKHFHSAPPEFFLLDRSQTEPGVFYGFKSRGAFYNSLEIARTLLTSNDVPSGNIHLVEATTSNEINIDAEPDLVISLISWGFHYPVETYLERTHEVMKNGGRLIIDVRKGTGGVEALRQKFRQVDVIADEEKYQRLKAIK
jgi:SAM-dependent methyltransferase